MPILMHLLSGLLFGFGLVVSGLINPAKVLSFLDISGAWDPSLALTMAVAVLATSAGYRMTFRNSHPLFSDRFHLPTATNADAPLILGSAMFGIGWGLVGYCPGPAIAALSFGDRGTIIFVVAMLSAMAAGRYFPQRLRLAAPLR